MFALTLDNGIARLSLERPEARNAIPAAGWAELAGRIADAAHARPRLLVLSGAGHAFCAGADLGDFAAMQADEASRTRFRQSIRSALDGLRSLDFPTVAWIDGACYGAGVALAIACDLRVAGRAARFAVTPAKVGLSYPQEDVHRLVELVGPGQAARLLFTAGAIDGAEAAAIGLVEIFDPEEGIDGVAAAILANADESLVALKRGIRLAADGVRSDADQDRRFDDLVGGEELARRLDALRRR
jgi:enoyl-CoA hydratase/carnithine racemase